MLTYNSKLPSLVLPEYGRNIQQMVDHCLTIEDKEQRTECANAIVDTMYKLFPPQGDKQEYMRKLWDHLQIMSGFKLDIDFPYEPADMGEREEKPDRIAVPFGDRAGFRHYGAMVEGLVATIMDMAEGEERDELVYLTASQMKKLSLAVNPEGVDDIRIFDDLRYMTHGLINITPDQMQLADYRQMPNPSKKKKKK